MARGNRQDLYLSVNGDVRGLQSATKVGRTVLNEFAGTATTILEEVEREFNRIGASGAPAGLKEAERAYEATFRRIGAIARDAANGGGAGALQIIDANAAREAAAASERSAAALRSVAEAAGRADAATGGQDRALRAYAVAAATAAVEEEQRATALREQARVLGAVETQLGSTTRAQQQANVVSGQARAGYQQLGFQINDIVTSLQGGISPITVFAQQFSQLTQAASMIAAGTAKASDGIAATGDASSDAGADLGDLADSATGVAEKVENTGTRFGAFAAFLAGPWGAAVTAAVVVLAPMVAQLLATEDALQDETDALVKNSEKAGVAAQAKKAFATTEAGLIDDVRSLTEEIEKQNEALKTNAERLNIRAKNRLELLSQRRDEVTDELGEARRAARLARAQENDFGSSEDAAARQRAIDAADQKVSDIEQRLAGVDDAIKKAEAARQRTRADLAGEAAARATDEVAAINYRYDGANGLIEQAKKRAQAEGVVTAELTRQISALKAQQKIDVGEAQKRQQSARGGDRQFGREIDVAGATAIVEGIGGRVTSGLRSTERQAQLYADKLAGRHAGPVAKPGTSAHETGNAIDVAFGKGISAASIKKAFADEGVSLRKIIREDAQKVYHVEFGAKGPSADTLASRRKADEDRATQNADAYASLLSSAKEAQFRLERGRVTTIEEAARLDAEAVDRQRGDLDRAVQKGVELDRWTQAEADAVKAINLQNAEAEKATIAERARAASVTQRADLERDALSDEATLLRLQGDLAGTAADRRAIARRLLKIEQEQVEIALRAQIAAERDPDRRAALQDRLGQVPQEFSLRGEQLDRQNADPLQAYGRRLVDATKDMDEALKGVAANGFATFEDASSRAAASAIGDLLKIKGVVGEVIGSIIQDLIRLAIQKAIVSAIGGSFFGLKDGGLIPGFASGGMVTGAQTGVTGLGGIPRYAGGGRPGRGIIRGAGTGRSDSILALVGGVEPILVSNGEGIVNAQAVKNYWPLIDAMNRGDFPRFADGGLVAPALPSFPSISAAQRAMQAPAAAAARPLTFDLRGAVLTEDLLAQMQRMAAETSGAVLREAAPAIVEAATTNTVARMRRPTL